jgi:hypothetical protein
MGSGEGKFGAELSDLWKTSEFSLAADGEIGFQYQSMEPDAAEHPRTFTGTWRKGPRPATT